MKKLLTIQDRDTKSLRDLTIEEENTEKTLMEADLRAFGVSGIGLTIGLAIGGAAGDKYSIINGGCVGAAIGMVVSLIYESYHRTHSFAGTAEWIYKTRDAKDHAQIEEMPGDVPGKIIYL